MSEPNVHEMMLMALAETHPRAHAVMEAIGCNRGGHPMIGLAAWLPWEEQLAVFRAAHLAHARAGTEGWEGDPEENARMARAVWTGIEDPTMIPWHRERVLAGARARALYDPTPFRFDQITMGGS